MKSVYLKLIIGFFVIVLYDVILDLLLGIAHFLFEIIHILFEFIEGFLEGLLEHLFHTTHHQSETILINLLLAIALYGLYHFRRVLPRGYLQFKRNLRAAWLRWEKRSFFCWRTLSTSEKIKLVAIFSAVFSFILFWLFFL